ncbi:MAG: ABC-three component system middle component 2, partial [Candidatus Paceibacterota bacterium]
LVHSSDITGAPKSLHPDLPNRSCEILVNRAIVQEGLKLLLTKGLVEIKYAKTGICYKSTDLTKIIISNFTTEYASMLNERASWVVNNYDSMSDNKLNQYITTKLGQWGSEFSREFVLEDGK